MDLFCVCRRRGPVKFNKSVRLHFVMIAAGISTLMPGLFEVVYFRSISMHHPFGHSEARMLRDSSMQQRLLKSIYNNNVSEATDFESTRGGNFFWQYFNLKENAHIATVDSFMERSCDEIMFEVGTEYFGNELLLGTKNSDENTANDCCRRCQILADCTHWTWTSDKLCSIRHGNLVRRETESESTYSGRVYLNLYVERLHNLKYLKTGAMETIEQLRIEEAYIAETDYLANCEYDSDDQIFLRSLPHR